MAAVIVIIVIGCIVALALRALGNNIETSCNAMSENSFLMYTNCAMACIGIVYGLFFSSVDHAASMNYESIPIWLRLTHAVLCFFGGLFFGHVILVIGLVHLIYMWLK